MALILKALAGISALVLLAVTLFGSLIAIGGALLAAIKLAVIVIFSVVVIMIVFTIVRDRSRRRHESVEF